MNTLPFDQAQSLGEAIRRVVAETRRRYGAKAVRAGRVPARIGRYSAETNVDVELGEALVRELAHLRLRLRLEVDRG